MPSADAASARQRRRRRLIGILLLLPAAVMAGLMLEEWRLDVQTERQFALRAVSSDAALRFGSAIVTVGFAMDAPRAGRRGAPVAVRVNGTRVVEDVPGRVAAYLVERRSDGWQRLVVAQNVSDQFADGAPTESVSRLLWIDAQGHVVEELVRTRDWFRSPLSTRLMRHVLTDDVGYRSNVLSAGWVPPIPQTIVALGFFGLAVLLRRRSRAGAVG